VASLFKGKHVGGVKIEATRPEWCHVRCGAQRTHMVLKNTGVSVLIRNPWFELPLLSAK
jgi:hypothetical protein